MVIKDLRTPSWAIMLFFSAALVIVFGILYWHVDAIANPKSAALYAGLVGAFLVAFFQLLSSVLDALRLRKYEKLGVEEKKTIPGLVWVRFFTTILIWGGFAYILLSSWDQSGAIIEHIRNYLVNGFQIIEFRIVPSKILMSLLFFALIIVSTGWIKRQLDESQQHDPANELRNRRQQNPLWPHL